MRIQDNIESEFDKFSNNYTHDMIHCVPHYLKLIDCLSDGLSGDFIPRRILDLGSGNGNSIASLFNVFPMAKYTLLDASGEMLDICKDRFSNRDIEYFQGYFQDFHFIKSAHDLITAGFSLHHLNSEEKRVLFQNVYSSLKDGGVFSYSDLMIDRDSPDHPDLISEWYEFVNSHYKDEEKWIWIMEHYRAFDHPDDYVLQLQWLEEAGFQSPKVLWREGFWVSLRAQK